MASIPVVLLNGTTADANEVMADFNEIYSNIDQTNIGVPNKTGTGRIVLDTNPTISGITTSNPTISGNITGTPTFLGRPTFSVGLTVPTTQTITLNVGGTTGITENSSNLATFFVNGSPSMRFRDAGVSIESGTAFWLDGGGDTYITESSANVMNFFIGGASRFACNTSLIQASSGVSIAVQPGSSLFVDGGGDTYIDEVSANVLRSVVGGINGVRQQFATSKVNSGFGGDGANPESIYAGGDITIGNASSVLNRTLAIVTPASRSSRIVLSHTGGDDCVINLNASNSTTISNAVGGTVSIATSGGSASFGASNCELTLPNLSAPTAITAASQRSFAKAWVRFDASGTIINSYNVTSIAHPGTGQYTIALTTSMTSLNTSTIVSAPASGSVISSAVSLAVATSGSSISVQTGQGGALADLGCHVVVFGT